ncbi:MAG: hypothetical protein HLUCCX10_04240 [Algoriphagus marincola HL-49]|uniref:Uncharacterized protein n=1 Tax=Algoriphagus marincola HL-49 TaxID=1305737 RepID=A0A0P7YTP2_9BACT|nr:MAG: hypothetical protein HLUCCX10_04240 [Algoriphagus marincola HL-49]
MKVVCIFELAGTKGKLFAAQFEGEEKDEKGKVQNAFSKLRAEWKDPTWFRSFFTEFRQDYFNFYGSAKLNSIVKEALDFADDLFEELADHVISGDLESLFKPLENSEKDQIYELQKLKVKGEERKSYLRLYAVRFRDEFVITGGTVKLTRFMKDRPHTKLEIIRLEAAVEFLRQNDIEGKVVYIEK